MKMNSHQLLITIICLISHTLCREINVWLIIPRDPTFKGQNYIRSLLAQNLREFNDVIDRKYQKYKNDLKLTVIQYPDWSYTADEPYTQPICLRAIANTKFSEVIDGLFSLYPHVITALSRVRGGRVYDTLDACLREVDVNNKSIYGYVLVDRPLIPTGNVYDLNYFQFKYADIKTLDNPIGWTELKKLNFLQLEEWNYMDNVLATVKDKKKYRVINIDEQNVAELIIDYAIKDAGY